MYIYILTVSWDTMAKNFFLKLFHVIYIYIHIFYASITHAAVMTLFNLFLSPFNYLYVVHNITRADDPKYIYT